MQHTPHPPDPHTRDSRIASANERRARIQQLNVCLSELRTELPKGISAEQVLLYQEALLAALRDLEEQGQHKRQECHSQVLARREAAKRLEAQRVANAIESSNMRQVQNFISSAMQKNDRAEYYQRKAAEHSARINQCKSVHEARAASKFDSLQGHEEDRSRKLSALGQTRALSARLHHMRAKEHSETAERVRRRALQEQETLYRIQSERLALNRAFREERSQSARNLREESTSKRSKTGCERREQGPSLRTIVHWNGPRGSAPTLYTIHRDHEARLELASASEAKANAAKELNSELQEALREALRQRAQNRTERVNESYASALDEKLGRIAASRQREREKELFVLSQKEALFNKVTDQGHARDQKIQNHKRKAEEITQVRANELRIASLSRCFRRGLSVINAIREEQADVSE